MILTGRVKTEYPVLHLRACYLNDLLCIEAHIAGNKTCASGVVCNVVEQGVCLQQRGGDFARAPWHVIPCKGLHHSYGQWGSSLPEARTALGSALLVPRRPRDRMGLRDSSRKHARHQFEWHVHRGSRATLGGRRFYCAAGASSPREPDWFRETDLTRKCPGRVLS